MKTKCLDTSVSISQRPSFSYITILSHLIAYRAYSLLMNKIREACRRCGYCGNANERGRRNYIERGLKVEQEWVDDHHLFYDWAMDNGYQIGLEMDRIDNDRGYFKDNIRFVSHKQNCRNTRKTRRINDVGVSFAEWYEEHVGETQENGKPSSLYTRFARVFDMDGLCGAEKLLEQLRVGTLNTERTRKNEPKDPKRNHILSGMFTEEEYTELLHHSVELRCSLRSLVRRIVGEWIVSVDG